MRIAFLCGSLELGRDGVGDYTRLLAEECVRQGHESLLISLHDQHLETAPSPVPTPEAHGIPTLRLPSSLPWPERIAQAGQRMNRFDPDWISLQFVCYAFHPRGFVRDLAQRLAPVRGNARWHIMLHELWVMRMMRCRLRDRLSGVLQRHYVLRFLQELAPAQIHTSIPLYAAIISRLGFRSDVLPLMGSIPIAAGSAQPWLEEQLRGAGIGDFFTRRDLYVAFGFFGTISDGCDLRPFMQAVSGAMKHMGKTAVVLSIGEAGKSGRAAFAKLRADGPAEIRSLSLGRRTTMEVSQFLQTVNFGVSTYSVFFVGKSSAAAAMREHGLPVIAAQEPERLPRGLAASCASADVLSLQSGLAEQLGAAARPLARNRIDEIGRQFIAALADS